MPIFGKHQAKFGELSKEENQHGDEFTPLKDERSLQSIDDKAERKGKLEALLLKLEKTNSDAKVFLKEMEQSLNKLVENYNLLVAIKDRVDD